MLPRGITTSGRATLIHVLFNKPVKNMRIPVVTHANSDPGVAGYRTLNEDTRNLLIPKKVKAGGYQGNIFGCPGKLLGMSEKIGMLTLLIRANDR
jgi:hypothetical protein